MTSEMTLEQVRARLLKVEKEIRILMRRLKNDRFANGDPLTKHDRVNTRRTLDRFLNEEKNLQRRLGH